MCLVRSAFVAKVVTSSSAGFSNRDAEQTREPIFEPPPYPERDVFARGIREIFDLVKVVMVEALVDGLKCSADLGVIYEPTRFQIHGAPDGNFAHEGVAVKPFTLMTRRDSWQPVRRFEPEFFD
jgi:hypothetical protein